MQHSEIDFHHLKSQFDRDGWCRFPFDPALKSWVDLVRPHALATRFDPDLEKAWLRGEGTWFVGVNALENDATGAIAGSGPIQGAAIDFIRQTLGFENIALDAAQVSICYPGFPKPMNGESAASFQYRLKRGAAHIDGLHAEGPTRARKLREYQGFLLGIPLTKTSKTAAPLVLWEGSHHAIAHALKQALEGVPMAKWPDIDLTKTYRAARRTAFGACKRVAVHALPGESYVLHRFTLHGVAPWPKETAPENDDGRAIIYFRPEIDRAAWLDAL